MKKCIIIYMLLLLCLICACGKDTVAQDDIGQSEQAVTVEDSDKEDSEVEKNNRKIIARALHVTRFNSGLPYILNSLAVIEAGRIQSAKTTQVDGERVLDIVAEDGTEFRIYLSGSGSVDAVKNLTTGEWPIASCR